MPNRMKFPLTMPAERTVCAVWSLLALIVCCWVSSVEPLSAQVLTLDGTEHQGAGDKKSQPGATPCMIWLAPEGPQKGILVCVHGLGLHKGCYSDFADRMTKRGWGLYSVDVRGFGNFMTMPQGARRVDFEGCLKDVREAIELVHKLHPGMPVFVVGESMGGGIAFQAGSRFSDIVSGVICSCPATRRHHTLSAAMRVGKGLLTGNHDMDVRPILVEHSTQKKELRQQWLSDSLARFELAPTELIEFQLFMDKNVKAAKEMKSTPVLILQGTADDLVKASAQADLLEMIPHNDKLLVYVDKSEHLILEEGQFDDSVISTVCSWLDDHIRGGHNISTASGPAPSKPSE